MNMKKFKKWLHGKGKADLIENSSIVLLAIAAAFTIIGITVGSFISGIPVFIAILGAFLVVVSLALYVFSEFYRIWQN